MNSVRQQAKQRYSDFHGILFQSNLTMVHDIAGEVSPDVTETTKERKRLAKLLAAKCIEKELETLNDSWWGRNFLRKRIGELHAQRVEILNS